METSNSLSQQQQQKQTLTLAPQQLASLSLLSLPVMELEARIAEEMSRNPVLEIDDPEPESADNDEFSADDPSADDGVGDRTAAEFLYDQHLCLPP